MFFCVNFQLRRLLSPQLQLAELESCQGCPVFHSKLRRVCVNGGLPDVPDVSSWQAPTKNLYKCPGIGFGIFWSDFAVRGMQWIDEL